MKLGLTMTQSEVVRQFSLIGNKTNLFVKMSIDLSFAQDDPASGPSSYNSPKNDPGKIRMLEVAGFSFRVILHIKIVVGHWVSTVHVHVLIISNRRRR